MKRKLIQAAIGVALASSASAAMAFNPSTTAPDYTVFISGSSAVSSTVRNFTIENVCDSSQDISVFRRNGTPYGDDWGVACRVNTATTGASAAKNVLFLKRDAGGSGYGVTPVTNGVAVNVLQVSVGAGQNCDTSVNPVQSATSPNGVAYNRYLCGSANVTLTPDAGFSDVEADKFKGFNTPSGLPQFDPSTALPFTAQPVAGLDFGIPVSLNFYKALQTVQFPTGSGCNPADANYASNSDTQACMPSLSKTAITSVFVGGIANWSKYMVKDPSNPNGPLIPITSRTDVTLPADTGVQICRRTPGSGTQATFAMDFLNAPCDANAVAPLDAPGNPFGGPYVADNSGSSDLGNCLADYSDGTNNSGQNSGSTTRWAIGLQFTTKNVGNTKDWRFIKVDGVAPTIQNVAAGKWGYYSEESMQWRTNLADLHNANTTADKNDTLTIIQYIANTAVSPTALAGLNNAYHYSFGDGGWLAIPSSTYQPRNPFDVNYPVNTSTHSFKHGPDTCQLPVSTTFTQVD